MRRLTGADTVQAVVHCYGANTFFMGLLAGMQGVRSVVCSQIATNLITPLATRIKTGLHLPNLMDALGIRVAHRLRRLPRRLEEPHLRYVLRLPSPASAPGVRQPGVHRITFMYALLYQHEQLGQHIHDNLHELFVVSNMADFRSTWADGARKAGRLSRRRGRYMPHMTG